MGGGGVGSLPHKNDTAPHQLRKRLLIINRIDEGLICDLRVGRAC